MKQRAAAKRTIRFPSALLWACLGIYVLVLSIIGHQNRIGPEYRWWSTVNLYLPQIAWGVPAVLLFAVALVFSRKPWWLPLLFLCPLLYVAGPLMGWCGAGYFARGASEKDKNNLRVMTYNVEGGHGDRAAGIAKAIALAQPDILLLQEASGSDMDTVLRKAHPDWHVHIFGELLIATPLPLSSVQSIPLPKLVSDPWKSPAYLRCVVERKGKRFIVYNAHFSTPRPALEAVRQRAPDAEAQLESNTATRLMQAVEIAQAAARETNPVIIAGDFNAPEPSLICRQIRGAGFKDAFSEAGRGYGYTTGQNFRFRRSFARIDHVYVSPAWRVSQCDVGTGDASDHRPVITDLFVQPL